MNEPASCSSVPITNNTTEQITAKSNKLLNDLIDEYSIRQSPIRVNFRKSIDWMSYGERASHMIHLYPAKLLPHIPAFFLSNDILSKSGDIVLDPFSGSGTVALEAILSGRTAVAADSNPLARLITKVKTTPIPKIELNDAYESLRANIKDCRAKKPAPNVVNIEYWYSKKTINQLSRIKHCINILPQSDIKDFFLVCFSNTVKRVSWSDPKLSVPVKLRKDKYDESSKYYESNIKLINKIKSSDAEKEFYKSTEANIRRMNTLSDATCKAHKHVEIYNDARALNNSSNKLGDNTVQLIITSPPYAGAQKYIRSSCLSLGWLGYCEENTLRDFEKKNIGREHHSKSLYSEFAPTNVEEADILLREIYKQNPLRSYIASTYILEMKSVFEEAYRVLKEGGNFVLVTAPNQICGSIFETQKYLASLATSLGFKIHLELIDDIHSRGLMTKRNKTAGIISSEWVYIFRKGL